jgi:hypothetical protein
MRFRRSVAGSAVAACLAMATVAGCGPIQVYDPDAPATSQAPDDSSDQDDSGSGASVPDEDDGDGGGATVPDEDDGGGGGASEPDE